jgi:hypothetical protein
LNGIVSHRPSGRGYRLRKAINLFLMAPLSGVVAVSMRLHHWGLGFRQYSFRHIARVLQVYTVNAFRCLPLLGHAVFPSGFHLQVNPMTQKSSSELLLSETGIQRCIPRRTLSPHRALHLLSNPALRQGSLCISPIFMDTFLHVGTRLHLLRLSNRLPSFAM